MSNGDDRQVVGREGSTSPVTTPASTSSSSRRTKRAREVSEDEEDAHILPPTKKVEVEGHDIKELYENRIRKLEETVETMHRENQGLRQQLHQRVCSTSIPMDEIKPCLESQVSNPEEFLEIPSHLKLVSEYEAMVEKRYCNTIIVIGPKGCGKTTSARMLHKSLLDQGKRAAYLDVVTVSVSSREYMTNVLVELRRQGIETLIIDNAEAVDLYPTIYRFEFVVAVFSPGAAAVEKIPSFAKKRGNGNSTRVYFRPLCMEWCEKQLEKFGCKLNEEDEDEEEREDEEDEERENAAQADNSTLPLKQLNRKQFWRIFCYIGGVPRYLQYCVRYGVEEGYKKMMKSWLII